MAKNRHYTLPQRRKRQKKTDYKLRLKLLISKKPRVVIRRSSNSLTAQIIKYAGKGDKIIATATTVELKKFNWKSHLGNIPSAYLLGLLLAQKSQRLDIQEAIIDLGSHRAIKGSSVFACCKGIEDGKISLNQDKKIYPSDERIQGNHIEEYAKKIQNTEKYTKQFSKYQKENLKPEDITTQFQETKQKIQGMKNGK